QPRTPHVGRSAQGVRGRRHRLLPLGASRRRARRAGGRAAVAPRPLAGHAPDPGDVERRASRGEHGRRALSGGPVWGAASADLNATLLEWPPGEGPAEHVNEERDVLYVVLDGTVTLTENGESRELAAGEATIVDKGVRRALVAGPEGARYLTAHIRRGGLEI